MAKQLDNIGYIEDKDIDKNRNFLKVMIENVNKMEQRIKHIEKIVEEQAVTITENKIKTIEELKTNKHRNEDKPGQNKPNVDKVQHPPKRNKPKFIPTTGISPGIGELADPDMREELSYAKVTSRRFKPPVNLPDEVITENPKYKDNEHDNEDDIEMNHQLKNR